MCVCVCVCVCVCACACACVCVCVCVCVCINIYGTWRATSNKCVLQKKRERATPNRMQAISKWKKRAWEEKKALRKQKPVRLFQWCDKKARPSRKYSPKLKKTPFERKKPVRLFQWCNWRARPKRMYSPNFLKPTKACKA